jgi:pimeloyl-ACP methyl ester carboxylesterase
MIVGTHRLDDEMLRLQEYSPVFDGERFAAHEKFFAEDVRQWARSRFGVELPAERTAVFGVSASGEVALAIGLRHPDIYSAVFCASPGGGYQPPAVMEPQYLIVQPVGTDDHGSWHVGGLKNTAPLRDQLAVTGEHDCLGRNRRDVHRHLPTTIVVERLGDELPRDGRRHSHCLLSSSRGNCRPAYL